DCEWELEGMTPASSLQSPARFKPGGVAGGNGALEGDDRRRLVRILVVDDDSAMREMVVNYLKDHHIAAVGVAGGEEMARPLATNDPSLVLLDLRLGQNNGLDLLREIRLRSDVPVIIITGDRREEIDRVVGLELGADDYVTKPFGLRELLARV